MAKVRILVLGTISNDSINALHIRDIKISNYQVTAFLGYGIEIRNIELEPKLPTNIKGSGQEQVRVYLVRLGPKTGTC